MKSTDISARGANLDGLMRSVKAGRISHAFLFSGPGGTGKKTCAKFAAQTVLCSSQDPPCGVCPECKQFLAGTHPDVHIVETDERSIYVDDVRALRDKLSLKPFEGGRHIVIITQADKLTAQAQNALLKTLEEPVGDPVFFLITDQYGAILPTIISRCRAVRFSPVSVEECARILEARGADSLRALAAAGCAQGRVGRAIEIDADKGYFELREKVLKSLKALEKGRAGAAEAAALINIGKESAQNALEIMEVTARDLMAGQNGGVTMSGSAGVTIDGRALLMGVMDMRRMLASNVSFSNAVEHAYLDIIGGAY